jgi:4-amino-4-deoxy-L-arabinose transferase-like glycosyltransferase
LAALKIARPTQRRVRIDPVVAAVVALTVVAALIRFWTLGRQSFWLDESTTVLMSRASFHDMAAMVWGREITPPLYYAAAWVWTRLFGDGEIALRALSTIAGVLVIPAAYAAGRALVDRRAGLLAAAFATVGPAFVWYSQEARSYSFLICFSAASLAFFARALRWSARRDFALWALASMLALASHYFALFLVGPEALWLLWRAADRRAARIATAGIAVAGVAIAPIALHQHAGASDDWIARVPIGERLHATVNSFTTGIGRPGHDMAIIVVVLVLAGVALAVSQLRGEKRRGALLALGLAAAAVALPLVLAAAGIDVIVHRNLLPAWLPLAVVVAAGLGSGGARWARAAGGLVALSLIVVFVHYDHVIASHPTAQRDNWRGVARVLGPPDAARAVVVTPGHQAQALSIYLPGARVLTRPTRVTEVDTVGSYTPGIHTAAIPRPAVAFRKVGERAVQRMKISRYRAPRPALVSPGAPPASNADQPPIVLLQPG